MGLAIERERFTAEDHAEFARRLTANLHCLRKLLARPHFGEGAPSIGTEVELHLIDAQAEPTAVNQAVLQTAHDPRLTLEINRFNLEINAAPVQLAHEPFSALGRDLAHAHARLQAAADKHGARALFVGTLPTLRSTHLAQGVLSDAARYRALSGTLRTMRGEPFSVRIKGHESLATSCDDVALEGANCSLQVHLRVAPRDLCAAFNAAQLTAAPLLAATGNSPYFDGKCLWEETRIALFQQAVDTRQGAKERALMPSRVSFGYDWLRDPLAQFEENVRLHPVLLPACSSDDDLAILEAGGVPNLQELRLHHGTVWNWNRVVFDPAAGGHFRIEHRVLPSGPTLGDMLANAALTVGLTRAFTAKMRRISEHFPFAAAQRNLLLAAKYGLSAELAWPEGQGVRPARALLLELLPEAARALQEAGVAAHEVDALLTIVRERVQSGRTGAAVQRAWVEQLQCARNRDAALREMTQRYEAWSRRDLPVHRWPLDVG